jgi:outer membrane receptor protein involved in Fe transport
MKYRLVKSILLLSGWLTLLACGAEAQTVPAAATASASNDERPLVLSPFVVNTSRDWGYRKSSSVTTSRIGVSTYESPQPVEIISGELLHDLGIDSIRSAFDYTASVTSSKVEVSQSGSYKLRGFDLAYYINGVRTAANTGGPGYISTDNIERIEIAKGPVGLFYGNTTPNGVANSITKKPEHVNRTILDLNGGSLGYRKGMIDTQAVVSKDHGLAYRIIASGSQNESRVGQEYNYAMLASSLSFRPNDKIQVELEYDTTNYKQPYTSTSTWNFMINPLYYTEVASPDQTMLNYIKSTYGAADDAAARAIIASRWGSNAPKASLVYVQTNWTADHFGAYGKIEYPYVGSTVNWGRISPYGDHFTSATPDSSIDGFNRLADASVTITPFKNTSIQYHWLSSKNWQDYRRMLFSPNPGPLDPDGRIHSLGVIVTQASLIDYFSDVRQLDFLQQVDFAGIKSKFIGGFEWRRSGRWIGTAALDNTRAPTRTAPDGTVTTGLATMQNFYPFSQPYLGINSVLAGPQNLLPSLMANLHDWYATYRGSAFDDKLNVVAGVRNVKQLTPNLITTGQNKLTKSYGVIGQLMPGLYAFGSYSTTFQYSNAYTVVSVRTSQPVPGEGKTLPSESGSGYDLGFKSAFFDEKLAGTISYFKVKRDNISGVDINRNVTDPRNGDADPNNDVRFTTAAGLQYIRGIDADLVWSPTRSLQFVSSFTYTADAGTLRDPSINTININITEANAQQYDKEFNHRLSKSPNFSGKLLCKYNFTDGRLKGMFVGGGVRHTGRYTVSDNFLYNLYVDTETLFDAFVGYHSKWFRIPTTVQLNLTNITNVTNDLTFDDGFVARMRVTLEF